MTRITEPRPGEPIRMVEPTARAARRYRAVVDVGIDPSTRKRKQVTKTFETVTAARKWVAETHTAVARGTYLAADRATFDALADRWLESKRDVRERTKLGYSQVLLSVRARIGDRRVQDLRRADIEALVSWLTSEGGQRGRGLSQRSVLYTLGAVRQVLAYAVAEGLLVSNPAEGVRAPRRRHDDEREVAVWDVADLLAFREVADVDEWAVGWRLTLCGMRRSEVLGLRWGDIDMEAGTVTIARGRVLLDGHRTIIDAPKSAASWRTVPVEAMHPGTLRLLRRLKAQQAVDRLAAGAVYDTSGGLVLVDAIGRGVRPEAYSDRFTELCKTAGVPRIRMHDVRHSVALMMHRAGQAPADVAALLGHTVQTHLSVYVPATERGAATAANAFGEVLAAAR